MYTIIVAASIMIVTGISGRGDFSADEMTASSIGSDLADGAVISAETRHRMPFRIMRNKVILSVRVNESPNLDVLLDTGMQFDGLFLYKKELRDAIGIDTFKEAKVGGAGSGPAANAVVADSVSFSIGDVAFHDQKIMVLQDDRFAGYPGDGVVGYSLFGHFAVEIDYDSMVVTLRDPEAMGIDGSWQNIPISFKDNKIPWVDAIIGVERNEKIPLSLYIDLASGEALELLTHDDMKFELPEDLEEYYLGRGVSGDITGHRGRISLLQIGPYALHNVITAFTPAHVRSKQDGADGVLSNNALRRFNVIFDYHNETLHLKPNGHYHDAFD
jgi:hypothetical protein